MRNYVNCKMLLYIKCHARWSCTCRTCQSPWVLKLATSMKNWIWLTFSPTFFMYPIDQTFLKKQHVNELWVEIVLKFKCWLLSKPLKEVKVTKLLFLSKYYVHMDRQKKVVRMSDRFMKEGKVIFKIENGTSSKILKTKLLSPKNFNK